MDKNLATRVLAGFGAIIALGIIWLIYNWVATLDKGTLRLSVIPSDATISIDAAIKTKPGDIRLKPGPHTITVSRDGFNSKAVQVTIEQGNIISQSIILTGTGQKVTDYFNDNQDEAAEAEGAAGAELNAKGQIITQNNPLIRILPYKGANYRIDYGVSEKYKANPEAVAIYITYNKHDESGKTNALKWIAAQGYDTATLEIIYQLSN